jgi:hypothetical protein
MTMKSFNFCGPSYSKIGTGILPFSITPADATSDRGRAAIMVDHGRAETYDLSGEAENGAIATADAACMRNLKGYVAADWMEARMQLQGVAVVMGALLGTTHPVLAVYTTFLRKYNAMEPRVWREFDLVYGAKLGPPLMVFHVQLQFRSWLQEQIGSDTHRALPDFCTRLRTLEQQNNLAWVPSCANVPQLQALQHVHRPISVPRAPRATLGAGGGGGGGSGGSIGRNGTTAPGRSTTDNKTPAPVRVRIRNPARRREFTGNSAMAAKMSTRRVAEAFALGGDPPAVVRSGLPKLMCVSWHCKGLCFEDCDRDHSVSSDSEAEEFMGWCQATYA